jgi:hypothetical protein
MFAKVRITAEQAGDGALLLRSADELGDYPVTVLHSVRAWAETDPDHPLIAERRRRVRRPRRPGRGPGLPRQDRGGLQAEHGHVRPDRRGPHRAAFVGARPV